MRNFDGPHLIINEELKEIASSTALTLNQICRSGVGFSASEEIYSKMDEAKLELEASVITRQVPHWEPFFKNHPNFKEKVIAESGPIAAQLKGRGVDYEKFHNLNAGRDVSILSEVFEYFEALTNGFGMQAFKERFKRSTLAKYEASDEFMKTHLDEIVQAVADHVAHIIDSRKSRLQEEQDRSTDERIAFLQGQLDNPDITLKNAVKRSYRKSIEVLLERKDRAGELEAAIEEAQGMLGKLEHLHYMRAGQEGFKLASRNRTELYLGDQCSDCTSASISGTNFWTVPTWLTDPGFNFLLQYDENGKLAHKFGFVWEMKADQEVILTIDSMELGNSQKAGAGMYENAESAERETRLMENAMAFIRAWAIDMGISDDQLYSTTISNTGTVELDRKYPKKTLSVAKIGGLDAVRRILKKSNPGTNAEPAIYLQSLSVNAENNELIDAGNGVENASEAFVAVELCIAKFLESEESHAGDVEVVRALLTSASDNPKEAARKFRIFAGMQAQKATVKALSIDGQRVDVYLNSAGLSMDSYFGIMLGKSVVDHGKMVTATLFHLVQSTD